MTISDAITDYFRKNWKDLSKQIGFHANLVADHSEWVGLIKDMKLRVTPTEDDIVINGFQYVGPGDLDLDVYLNVDHILEFPIDHFMFARESLIPWLNRGILKYFGINLNTDFADIHVNFYDNMGDVDSYEVPADYGRTKPSFFYDHPSRFWVKTDKKQNINEQIKKTKSLYLTFPKQGWETIGGYLMKSLGIVTGVFTSVDGAIAAVRKKRKNIDPPLKELVIGSHGNGQYLLMGGGKDGYPVDNLLREVSDLVGPDTTVFFTACYGGDFLMNLCHASAILGGHEVHGSAGIYNYISNTSQKGFYSCTMSPTDYQDIQTNFEKRNLIFGTDKGNDYLLDKGFCRRESSAPINWAKNIWT